jgi:hypothetical protein
MNWADEPYIRVYKRVSPDWGLVPWQTRSFFEAQLCRLVDRSGVLELGKAGVRGIVPLIPGATLADLPAIEEHIRLLCEDGCVRISATTLVIPNFLAAQEARQSDRQRQADSRGKRRAAALGGNPVKKSTEEAPEITSSHSASPDVTGGHSSLAELSLAEPSPLPPNGAPGAVAPVGGGSPSASKGQSEPEPHPSDEFDRYAAYVSQRFRRPNLVRLEPRDRRKAERNFASMRREHSYDELVRMADALERDEHVRTKWPLAKVLTSEGYDRATAEPAPKGTTGPSDSKAKRPTPFAPPGPVTPPVVTDPDAFNGLPAKVTPEHARQVLASVPKPSFMGGPKQTGT